MVDNTLRDFLVEFFNLKADQAAAALERTRNVAVTAGAGSGKTRTLVARYTMLLAEGHPPRSVVAITFTEKAAREMRSRVREALNDLAIKAASEIERQRWLDLTAHMDSARIGTIHSLCAEILRAHPAEAGIDPRFDVLDEGLTAALRAEVVEDTLAILVEDLQFSLLIQTLGTEGLKTLLSFMLENRLEAETELTKPRQPSSILINYLSRRLNHPAIASGIQNLKSFNQAALLSDAGPKLAQQIMELLNLWSNAEAALAAGDPVACASALFTARREKMKLNIGSKSSQAKETLDELRAAFDRLLHPLTGGQASKDEPPDAVMEAQFASVLDLAWQAFKILLNNYHAVLEQRRALDFDDLEAGAAKLLEWPAIRNHWCQEISALLVDEFQDTNHRQRAIVEALSGEPGRLFIVGDPRQSIYRFRRADVTVFRQVLEETRAQAGFTPEFNTNFRAHAPLLTATGDLLEVMMGTRSDPDRPYYIPYTPLVAHKPAPDPAISSPYLELIIGSGEDTIEARPQSARALAQRLLQLKEAGDIGSWDEITLLFRASGGFTPYEDAFEDMGIPFVTVAGRGFYNRPEIRDVLNILHALADPADDLAMAGLLRSPAFGLSDAALYRLRWQRDSTPTPYFKALQGDLSILDEADRPYAERALRILLDLLPQVDRIPVAELLKMLVDAVDFRAILAVPEGGGTSSRLWRNLDKLLMDAQSSGQVNLRGFLNFVDTLNDAGAREGEAPSEAQGAVRLMTIHKSKGLDFPVVILADAGRITRVRQSFAYLLPETGLVFKLPQPTLLYRLARSIEEDQSQAEDQRLLYVALTRARQKLIINGHHTAKLKGTLLLDVCKAVEISPDEIVEKSGIPREITLPSGEKMLIMAIQTPPVGQSHRQMPETNPPKDMASPPLFAPLPGPVSHLVAEDEPETIHPWRVTGSSRPIPPGILGNMVHKALELWIFPDSPRFLSLMETSALNAGLTEKAQKDKAVQLAAWLLSRLGQHPLRREIENTSKRYHELPYSRMVPGHAETGYLDILYRTSQGWQVVDFKTDAIRSDKDREKLIAQYQRQIQRYADAVNSLLGERPRVRLCFLDDDGKISLVETA
ncbi:MAG TPA: UvrD-helicase domain-containing protein [Anaerolineaceae bacterium]|nr:UvrD-helicase domain-containing protein [Anaerolineaceae bacterium]HPN51962.1 UvrD-helicase domain-containing protein [Anaerolineaceae bacterium]